VVGEAEAGAPVAQLGAGQTVCKEDHQPMREMLDMCQVVGGIRAVSRGRGTASMGVVRGPTCQAQQYRVWWWQ
jgi:hypothetical protein